MAEAKTNGKPTVEEEEDWEYEDEEAEDYEWEYETEDEEEEEEDEEDEQGEHKGGKGAAEIPLDEQELPDPFSTAPITATTKKDATIPTNGHAADKKKSKDEDGKKHKKHHKKSRHLERIELFKKKEEQGDEFRNKKIHVRSKDPSRIARQFEKQSTSSKSKSRGKVIPPPQKVNQICKICNKEPYLVERVVAEKSWWHKNCFRCKQCNKILTLDTYMSHEGVLYCKPHHRELFQPKVVKSDIIDVDSATHSQQEAIARHREQERRMETIVRENNPVDLGDSVVKCTSTEKYAGLENLDVGSKFKMFEKAGTEPEPRGPSSDRYGIMEKLKRLQEGADLEDLLAEIDEELPSDENEDEYDEETAHLTAVQKKTMNAEKLFSEDVKREKLADERRKELKAMRQKLMVGTHGAAVDQFDDLLNSSSHKIKKTKVDVRSQNAKKFRDMFDKGEVPEGNSAERIVSEKDAELEMMRKAKRQQREYFKKMEAGKLEDDKQPKEPKLLVGKLKDRKVERGEDDLDEDMPEMASLSNRFSYFENFTEHEDDRKKKRSVTDGNGEEMESDMARRECKASSVLSKFKAMENKAINGEEEVGERRRPMKRFTPPRKLGSDSESEAESGSGYSDSEYSDSSYTSSYSSESSDGEEVDETLKAIRSAQRAKELRAKFEEWEQTQDARDQMAQMMIHDENGDSLETANVLRRKFEALKMHEAQAAQTPPPGKPQFRPKRFK